MRINVLQRIAIISSGVTMVVVLIKLQFQRKDFVIGCSFSLHTDLLQSSFAPPPLLCVILFSNRNSGNWFADRHRHSRDRQGPTKSLSVIYISTRCVGGIVVYYRYLLNEWATRTRMGWGIYSDSCVEKPIKQFWFNFQSENTVPDPFEGFTGISTSPPFLLTGFTWRFTTLFRI